MRRLVAFVVAVVVAMLAWRLSQSRERPAMHAIRDIEAGRHRMRRVRAASR